MTSVSCGIARRTSCDGGGYRMTFQVRGFLILPSCSVVGHICACMTTADVDHHTVQHTCNIGNIHTYIWRPAADASTPPAAGAPCGRLGVDLCGTEPRGRQPLAEPRAHHQLLFTLLASHLACEARATAPVHAPRDLSAPHRLTPLSAHKMVSYLCPCTALQHRRRRAAWWRA